MAKAKLAWGAVYAALLLCGAAPVALAQNNGTGSTTGPAAGNNVVPNTAQSEQKQMSPGGGQNTGAGAAGVAAKPNTESGPQVKTPGNGQQQQ